MRQNSVWIGPRWSRRMDIRNDGVESSFFQLKSHISTPNWGLKLLVSIVCRESSSMHQLATTSPQVSLNFHKITCKNWFKQPSKRENNWESQMISMKSAGALYTFLPRVFLGDLTASCGPPRPRPSRPRVVPRWTPPPGRFGPQHGLLQRRHWDSPRRYSPDEVLKSLKVTGRNKSSQKTYRDLRSGPRLR